MFMMLTVLTLCLVVLMAKVLALICRHRPDMWIAHEDSIMCFAAPVAIALLTFGGVSFGWRITHGGLGSVPWEGWAGSAVIVGLTVAVWLPLAAWARKGGKATAANLGAPVES